MNNLKFGGVGGTELQFPKGVEWLRLFGSARDWNGLKTIKCSKRCKVDAEQLSDLEIVHYEDDSQSSTIE